MSKRQKDNETENPVENNEETITDDTAAPVSEDNGSGADAAAGSDQEKDTAPTAEELLNAEKDKYLRLLAEYDNYRKRSQKEREALFTSIKSETVLQILPVYDNLERALALKSTDEAFYKGIEMTMAQLKEIFEKLGVKPIEAVGQKFDANLHNAIMHIEDENCGENEVVEEFQKGFLLGDKVIRFSMVKVAN
ncbi:MAG: nucleotide exchange factor GrpE [Oscillospiraceae bacterium]